MCSLHSFRDQDPIQPIRILRDPFTGEQRMIVRERERCFRVAGRDLDEDHSVLGEQLRPVLDEWIHELHPVVVGAERHGGFVVLHVGFYSVPLMIRDVGGIRAQVMQRPLLTRDGVREDRFEQITFHQIDAFVEIMTRDVHLGDFKRVG